ncbi:hypothetical protein [Leptospira biflexa]|nr:hypothetical protein [Leptospira biflexa]
MESPVKLKAIWFQNGIQFLKAFFGREMLRRNQILKKTKISIRNSTAEARFAVIENYSDLNIQCKLGENRSVDANKFFDFGVTLNLSLLDKRQIQAKRIELKFILGKDLFSHQTRSLKSILNSAIIIYETVIEILKKLFIAYLSVTKDKLNFSDLEFKIDRLNFFSYLELDTQLHEIHHALYGSQLECIGKFTQVFFLRNNPEFTGESYAK